MSSPIGSVLDTQSLSVPQIRDLFDLARKLSKSWPGRQNETGPHRVIGLLFFEPSTRTRLSFEVASHRLGYRSFLLDSVETSSLAKGETLEDTFLNVAAMRPDVLIVRAAEDEKLIQQMRQSAIPVVSAGYGVYSHPTQALLDAYTIESKIGDLSGKRILFLGDIAHSRVAQSDFELFSRLGAEVGFCAPEPWWPKDVNWKKARHFLNRDEGLKWCDVCIGLRVQFERHLSRTELTQEEYHLRYGVGERELGLLSPQCLILHPGPINFGFEFSESVMKDSRQLILKQVENGVLIRAALLMQILRQEYV